MSGRGSLPKSLRKLSDTNSIIGEFKPNHDEGDGRKDFVVLRRKPSKGPSLLDVSSDSLLPGEDEQSQTHHHLQGKDGSTTHQSHRISRVHSVCEDVMSGEPIRMMGWMEKRSKLKGWKKLWFILDGHLLTYFKSKNDYEKLSPASGSISLSHVSFIRPIQIKHCKGFPIEIVCRNQVYHLKCSEKSLQEEWVLALQETISVPTKISSPVWADPGVQFYRYSFANLSKWSLEENPNDISGSLKNLPKNFYLKHDKSQFSPGLKVKCHSYSTLPLSEFNVSPLSEDSRSDNFGSSQSLNSQISRTEDCHCRLASSMLVMESSPQAAELKKELASKLSLGKVVQPSKIRGGTRPWNSWLNPPNEPPGNKIQENCGHNGPTITPSRGCPSNSRTTIGTMSKSGSLASIAEGLEPNLIPCTESIPDAKKKKKRIGNLIQKIFKRDSFEAEKVKPMVISGPVDLKARRVQSQGHLNSSQSSPISNTSSEARLTFPIAPNKTEAMINELRTVQLRRNLSTQSSNSEVEVKPIVALEEGQAELSQCSSYNEKLAKFNRLSATLLPALTTTISCGPQPPPICRRSSSCRVKSTHQDLDQPPALPPKKRNIHGYNGNPYDTPKNNQCVSPTNSEDSAGLTLVPSVLTTSPERKSLRELLIKKNSAPEINFEGVCIESVMSDNLTLNGNSSVSVYKEAECDCSNSKPRDTPIDIGGKDHLEIYESEPIDRISCAESKPTTFEDEEEPFYSTVAEDESPIPIDGRRMENIYEEVKYATIETLFTELEAVQEFDDDEEAEMYDEFLSPTPAFDAPLQFIDGDEHDHENIPSKTNPRDSGMSALQQYLNSEYDDGESDSNWTEGAAVNRLGRSLAVDKLKHLVSD